MARNYYFEESCCCAEVHNGQAAEEYKMGGSLKKEEAEEAYALWRDIAVEKGKKALTMEMLQVIWDLPCLAIFFLLLSRKTDV